MSSTPKVVHVATEERYRSPGMFEEFFSHEADFKPRFYDATVTTDTGKVIEATSTDSMAAAIEKATNQALKD